MAPPDSSYSPPPNTVPPGYEPFSARRLPDPQPLPLPRELPALPTQPRHSPFRGWKLTTHLTPSAYPRAHRSATTRLLRPSYPPQPGLPKKKDERKRETEELMQSMWAQRKESVFQPSWRTPREGDESRLWNVVNRFSRSTQAGKSKSESGNRRDRVTLFLAHANGFVKELWEPVLSHLLRSPEVEKMEEIWVWEAGNHGDAALANEGKLGDTFDWADGARDILQFLLFHRPLVDQEAPMHLPPHPAETEPRTIIGIGHSFGSACLARAALHNPHLFSTLILADPVLVHEHIFSRRASEQKRFDNLVRMTLSRRSTWSSREEARATFLRHPFFKGWDPAALEAYVQFALCPIPAASPRSSTPCVPGDGQEEPGVGEEGEGGVMLKQNPYDEASLYCEPRDPPECWSLLPLLPQSVELRWVMSGKGGAEWTAGEEATQYTVWRRRARAENVRLGGVGHLIPMEAPGRFAEEIAGVLAGRHNFGRGEREGAKL